MDNTDERIREVFDATEWRVDVDDFRVIGIGLYEGVEIVVYRDEEPFDWGDIDPTPDERANIEVIGVAVRVAGEPNELDSIWSVGFFNGDWERTAVETAVYYGFLSRAARERSERAYWAACDVITV